MSTPPTKARMNRGSAMRAVARKLALQALYSWQLNPRGWPELMQEFLETEDGPRADREYLQLLLERICTDIVQLDEAIGGWADRPSAELDPIERAALLIGVLELRSQLEVPYRVAISEAVSLARRFGATDGHKFVNAVLDRAARTLRPHET